MVEIAHIETVRNPNYHTGASVEMMTTQVRFEGLTGKAKEYVERANSASYWTMFFIAQKMIATGCSFVEAAKEIISKELQQVREKRGLICES